jgi:hypothetical protein
MNQFPREIAEIIVRYALDMQLLISTPYPGKYTGAIVPLNFEIVFESTNLTELLLKNILEAVMDSGPCDTLTTLFLFSRLAECIDFPLHVINNFENACSIWNERCKLYNLPQTLPPTWSGSLPYLIFEFLKCFDVDLLNARLKHWLGNSYDISFRPATPFVMLHPLL